MKKAGVKPNVTTYTTLMNAYGTNPTKAEEVLTRMKIEKVKPDVKTYTTLMNAYGTNHTKAEEVLTRMKKDGVKPDVTTYTTLMNAYGTNSTKANSSLYFVWRAAVVFFSLSVLRLLLVNGTTYGERIYR